MWHINNDNVLILFISRFKLLKTKKKRTREDNHGNVSSDFMDFVIIITMALHYGSQRVGGWGRKLGISCSECSLSLNSPQFTVGVPQLFLVFQTHSLIFAHSLENNHLDSWARGDDLDLWSHFGDFLSTRPTFSCLEMYLNPSFPENVGPTFSIFRCTGIL